jgi:hypothetical protein
MRKNDVHEWLNTTISEPEIAQGELIHREEMNSCKKSIKVVHGDLGTTALLQTSEHQRLL